MKVTINGIEHELTFTFNSFRYMEDFEVSDLSDIGNKPFKTIKVLKELLLGALNADPKSKVSPQEVQDYVELIVDTGEEDIFELLEILMEELTNTSFFKQLQKSTTPQKKKVVKK